jgi:hypothetical protein
MSKKNKKEMKKKKDEDKSIGGALVPAGLLIGMGFGFLTGHLLPGIFIGLGAGLIAYFIAKEMKK